MGEHEKMLLADAIETAIKSDRKLIKLKRLTRLLITLILVEILIILVMYFRYCL